MERIETKFNEQLQKYTKMYKTYASGASQMRTEDEKLVKANIQKDNSELMSSVDELYETIMEMNKWKDENTK